ncbi:hypothetical protein Tco_0354820, partial [Tanacetum coccineum]
MKKPLRKLLYEKGNLHDNVIHLRSDLDQIQTLLDKDPFNSILREKEADCVVEFNQAVLLEIGLRKATLIQLISIKRLKVGLVEAELT